MQKQPAWKRAVAAIFGAIALLLGLGGTFGIASWILHAGFLQPATYLDVIFSAVFGSAYMFLGAVGLQFGISGVGKSKAGITWWKIVLGAILLIVEIKNHIAPSSNLFRAENESEQLGMSFAAVVICFVAVWLIISGIRARYVPVPRPANTPSTPQL